MPLNFSSVAIDLQILIAKKVDFWDLVQLQLSSKQGKTIGNAASQSVVIKVNELSCKERIVRVSFVNGTTNYEIEKQWRYIREFKKLPIFSVSKITLVNVSPEYMMTVLDEMKTSKKEGTNISWYQKEDDIELFIKCSENFNVTKFYSTDLQPETNITFLPQFRQIESVEIRGTILPNEFILTLQSHTIRIHHYRKCYMDTFVVNRFLKQWAQKQREIRSLFLDCVKRPECEDLFDNLPALLICSNVNLRSPNQKLYKIYVMDRGDKLLRIDVSSRKHLIGAEVENRQDFESEIDGMVENGDMQRTDPDGILPPLSWRKRKFDAVKKRFNLK